MSFEYRLTQKTIVFRLDLFNHILQYKLTANEFQVLLACYKYDIGFKPMKVDPLELKIGRDCSLAIEPLTTAVNGLIDKCILKTIDENFVGINLVFREWR